MYTEMSQLLIEILKGMKEEKGTEQNQSQYKQVSSFLTLFISTPGSGWQSFTDLQY